MPSLRHIYNTPCSKKCQQLIFLKFATYQMNTVQGEKDLRRDRKQILYYTVFNLRNFVSFSYLGIEIHQSNFLFLGQSVSSGVRSITISTLVLSIFLCSKHAAKAQNPQKAVKLAAVCTFPVSFAEKIQSFHHSVSTSSVTI